MWETYCNLRLRALQESPDAFGSTFSAEATRTPAEWRSRLESAATSGADLPLIAVADSDAVGLAWAKVDARETEVVNIFQMWVAPESRGNGISRQLLQTAVSWAREQGARDVQLGVTVADSPAYHLYTSAGFVPFGPPELLRPDSALHAQTMRLRLSQNAG